MSSTARFVQNAARRRAILNCQSFSKSQIVRLYADQHLAHHRLNSTLSRSSFLRSSNVQNLRSQPSALPILLPHRFYSTETSTHGGDSGNFPPPGFNAKEAQKPLPKDDSKSASKQVSASDVKKDASEESAATAEAKTRALERASLSELAAEKAAAAKAEEMKMADKKEEKKKLTIGQKIKKEIQHYWDGTKLLATEVRISSRLALKMAAGYELSRRENRQVGVVLPLELIIADLILSSFNVLFKISLDSFRSQSLSLSHLQNCYCQSLFAFSRTCYPRHMKVNLLVRKRLPN